MIRSVVLIETTDIVRKAIGICGALLLVWSGPSLSQPVDAAEKLLSTYYASVEEERASFKKLETLVSAYETSRKRLENESASDEAFFNAIRVYREAENRANDAALELGETELNLAILRDEEKRKRKKWDELNRIKQYLPPEELAVLEFVDLRLREIGKSYSALFKQKEKLQTSLGGDGDTQGLWSQQADAADKLLTDLSVLETSDLVTPVIEAQLEMRYALKEYELARQRVHHAFETYQAVRNDTPPPYIKSVKVFQHGILSAEFEWIERGVEGYSEQQIEQISKLLRSQIVKLGSEITQVEEALQQVVENFREISEIREELDSDYHSALSTARAAHLNEIFVRTAVDISVVLAEVYLTGGTAAVISWSVDQGANVAQKILLRSEGKAIRAAGEQIGTEVWSEIKAQIIHRNLAKQQTRLFKEVRDQIVERETETAYRKLVRMFPGINRDTLRNTAKESGERAAKKFSNAFSDAALARSDAETAKAVSAWFQSWQAFESEAVLGRSALSEKQVQAGIDAAFTVIGTRKSIGYLLPDLTNLVKSEDDPFSFLGFSTAGSNRAVAAGLASDGLEVIVDRSIHLLATGGVAAAEKAGLEVAEVFSSVAYKSGWKEVGKPRVSDFLSVVGAASKALSTGYFKDIEFQAWARIVELNALSRILAADYLDLSMHQQKLLTAMKLLRLQRSKLIVFNDAIFAPRKRELVESELSLPVSDLAAELVIEVAFSRYVTPGTRSNLGGLKVSWDGIESQQASKVWRGRVSGLETLPFDGHNASRFPLEIDAIDLFDRVLDSQPQSPAWKSAKETKWPHYEPGVDQGNYKILFEASLVTRPSMWTSWTKQSGSSPGQVEGIVLGPNESRIGVTYTGEVKFAQMDGAGNNYWVPDTPYLSAQVPYAPEGTDIIALVGGSGIPSRIDFSTPVKNPVMAIVSMGQGGAPVTYNFDHPFLVLSYGHGFWGDGHFELSGTVLKGHEAHGVIQFQGVMSQINWTIPDPEDWHGFTIGIPFQ